MVCASTNSCLNLKDVNVRLNIGVFKYRKPNLTIADHKTNNNDYRGNLKDCSQIIKKSCIFRAWAGGSI